MRDESIVRDALEWGRNATEASAALDRIVADRDELKRQMKLIQDGKGRGTSNLTDDPSFVETPLSPMFDRVAHTVESVESGLSRTDRMRLWRGIGKDPADLPDDLSDAGLHAMVARFTSNA